MRNWLSRIASWLLKARLFLLTLALFLAAILLLCLTKPTEPHIRLSGLLLQLLGLSTVIYGISTTRSHFGLPTLSSSALNWLRSFPPRHIPPVTLTGVGNLQSMTAFGRATVRAVPPANATLKDRVRILEDNFATLDRSIVALQQQVDEADRARTQALSQERAIRSAELQSLRKKLELAETGGLDVSFWGLVWLMVGLVLSTASYELTAIFHG